jgi:hypothetical protein
MTEWTVGTMTTSSLEASTPDFAEPKWLRDLVSARTSYEELFGWPVSVRVAERQVVIAIGPVVDAVTMPAGLGASVQAQLAIAMLAGPVLLNPDGQHWTFLVQPAPGFRGDFGEVVAEHGVWREAAGTHIAIPALGSAVRWAAPPRPNRTLPSIYAVAAVTRRMCSGRRG